MSLASDHSAAKRSEPCPDAHMLAVLIEQGASLADRPGLVEHLAACEDCRQLVGALGRMNDAGLVPVPDELFATAVAVTGAGRPALARRWQMAAAAACLIIGVGLWRGVVSPSNTDTGATAVSSSPPTVDAMRGTGPLEPPRLLEPPADGTVGGAPIVFRWTPVDRAVQYRVQLLSADGDIVWSETTSETSLRFDRALAGGTGLQYYAWVAAQMPEGRRLQSPVVRLAGPAR